jgi:hypothetical protein
MPWWLPWRRRRSKFVAELGWVGGFIHSRQYKQTHKQATTRIWISHLCIIDTVVLLGGCCVCACACDAVITETMVDALLLLKFAYTYDIRYMITYYYIIIEKKVIENQEMSRAKQSSECTAASSASHRYRYRYR